ncbi:hypothetical protein [Streptomyces halobius]|uniref:Uncharacterized protein n=1 Tax=Streptomyces halobius TaxID=2879846 RepID=A0ABY4M2Y1_9ACTN|nr:hypothetical protein [Streptomyces halobius]UQA92121.1 hypothetical protein K9S39_09920 [Streptomyces halobius]
MTPTSPSSSARPGFQRPAGTIKVGMIFVDFPDAPAIESPADGRGPSRARRGLGVAGVVRQGMARHHPAPALGADAPDSTDYHFERGFSQSNAQILWIGSGGRTFPSDRSTGIE